MKRVLSFILVLTMTLTLCACGSSSTDKALSGEDESSAPATNEPFTFRGITFASTRDEIKEVEGDNISFESSILMRVFDVNLGGYSCDLFYNFHDETNEQKLTSILPTICLSRSPSFRYCSRKPRRIALGSFSVKYRKRVYSGVLSLYFIKQFLRRYFSRFWINIPFTPIVFVRDLCIEKARR